MAEICSVCKGTGEAYPSGFWAGGKITCKSCGGSGRVETKTTELWNSQYVKDLTKANRKLEKENNMPTTETVQKLIKERDKLETALDLAVNYLKEWQSWYEEMGKHQQYDFRDKLKEIEVALK